MDLTKPGKFSAKTKKNGKGKGSKRGNRGRKKPSKRVASNDLPKLPSDSDSYHTDTDFVD